MKQKRKVKSLIPSKSGSNVFLTTLLFLLWWILCFWAVRLFTSSMWVEAADAGSIEYPWIADKHEVLLKFWLIPKGGDTPLNEMYLTWTTFVISGDNWVSVNIGNSNDLDKYVNYLWWDGWMNISSDNITIIWGSADEVYQNNDDATVLWWMHNKVDEWNNKASPVILWWEGRNDAGYKTIWKNQEGSAVVWWQNNEIKDNGSYDFILWGENNKIDGSNVIVWWSRVNVDEKSNVFAFSHGDSAFEPESENAFYLNLKNGLWLNRTAVNDWVDSNWAVSFWEVNIVTQKCTSADKWVQWTWQGCLVGCTETSAASLPSKWEMIDHGTGCEKICENNSSYCMINPIKIEVNSNPSYCTNIGVDTGHSHHCGGEENILPTYKDVLFETVLIDSDAKCPDPADPNNWTENRCVFKCDGWYHLTWGADGRARCYKDCELVWDHSTIKHNETVTAYKRTDTNCSYNSDAQKGPYTCKNYKATLVCDNWTLKVKQSFASSIENGKDAYDLWYQYNECMLHQYRCPATYNYNKSQIDSVFKDAPTNGRWNIQNRQKIVWTRWQYKLCVDYDAVTRNTVQYLNGESCFERDKNADNSYNLHYQWLGCNDHYHTWSRSNYVCMKDCTLKNPNGTTKYYLHETRITGYKNGSVDCGSAGNGKCESETLICNDGKWTKLNGAITDVYKYNDCSLNDFNCSLTEYNVDESTKTAHQGESVYASSCISYDGQDDKVTCSKRRTDYKLTNCVGWHSTYHTDVEDEGRNKWCISNDGEKRCRHAGATVSHHFHYINALVPVRWSGTAYNNWSWSTPANCWWECDTNYHEDEEEGDCISNSRNVNCSDYYTLPANASWKRQGYQTWNISQGKWNSPLYCSWDCNSGWHENAAGTACEKDCTVVSCSAYTLDSCPDHWHCSECTKVDASCNDGETKLQLDYCDTDYEVSSDGTSCEYNPSCTANYCSAYGLDECPEWWNCSWCTIKYTDCTNWDQKARLDSCEDGWTKVWDTCVKDNSWCTGCPSGAVGHGWTCTSYGPCSSTAITSTCSNGVWNVEPWQFSLPNQGDCTPRQYPCGWDAPEDWEGVQKWTPGYSIWHTPTDWTYVDFDDYYGSACTWTCGEWHVKAWNGCAESVPPNPFDDSCLADTYTYGDCSYSIPALSSWWNKTVSTSTSSRNWSVTASCSNWTLSYSDKSCNKSTSCGTAPTNSSWVVWTYAQSWNGSAWSPSSKSKTCVTSSSSTTECSFICDSGKTCDGNTCITVCGSSGNPAGCNGLFSPTYGWVATWWSSYSYTCKYWTLSYSCSATCPTGTYWFGLQCKTATSICDDTHNGCVDGWTFVNGSAGSKTLSNTTTYTWKCKRGDYTENCSQTVNTCDDRDSQECETPDIWTAAWTWDDQSCSCQCPSGTSFESGNHGCECPSGQRWNGSKCVSACSNALEAQNCEVGQWWSAQWTWNDRTCSCDCPAGTIVTDDNHCVQEGGETGGGTCDTYREFNPSWALYCPAPSGNYDSQCNSEAWAGWSCSFNDSCPGRVPMCECTRSDPCQGCSAAWACSAANHGDTCVTYTVNTTYWSSCSTYKRTSKCDNGTWDRTPGAYSSCSVVQESCEQDEIEVSYGQVQYYQDTLNYSCSCQNSICCCSAPCECASWENREHADSQTACDGIRYAMTCYPLQCSDDGRWSVDICRR